MNHKPRLAIDMDEVIADTIDKFVTLYKTKHGFETISEHMHGKEFHDILPDELKSTLRPYLNEKGFFRDIPPMADSQRVVKALSEKYDVYIASAAIEFRLSLEDKLDWLAEHFSFIPWTNIVFCGHKILNVDIMIDDRVRNFAYFNGRKILFSSPHNYLIEGYERVNNWNEVENLLL